MYGRRTNYLFQGSPVHGFIHGTQTRAMRQLEVLDENTILNTPTEDLVAGALSACAVDFPTLREGEIWQEDNEVLRDMPYRGYDFYTDQHGGTRTVTSHVITVHVPFDGDESLFNVEPTRRSIPGPAADINGQELIITITTDQKTEQQLQQEYLYIIQSIKDHLSTLTRDLSTVATQIEGPARTYVEQRKAQLLKNKNLAASLGFPMRRRADAPATYRAPEVRRKLTAMRPQVTAPFKPEPALDEKEYQHILSVMDNMTRVMERSPTAFQTMEEEHIRMHFLVQLNAQYEGQATGETFNFSGKTDILIRSENRNIFVAECKFWSGEKAFLKTVDQLLSYLSWRDSKVAVVIFNRNKQLSGVLDTIKGAMEKHPHNKKHGHKIEGETRFRYVMSNPGDPNREIIMTVMVYDIPAPA